MRYENLLLKKVVERLDEEARIKQRLSGLSSPVAVASVIGSDYTNIFKSLLINRGRHHQVKPNTVVLDPQGNVLGRVIEPIQEWTSFVQLITDEAGGVGAKIKEKGIVGVLRGDGRGRCYLDYVLASAPEISVGEEVVTSGLDNIYPAGLPLGRVISVGKEATLFKKILVEPYFRLNELTQVALLTFDLREF